MKPLGKLVTRSRRRRRRHLRMRKRVNGTAARPRLAVFRSATHIYAQLIDDEKGHTLCSASDLVKDFKSEKAGKVGAGFVVGKALGAKATGLGIKQVVFDRGGFPYHGRIKAVADGAREAGLEF